MKEYSKIFVENYYQYAEKNNVKIGETEKKLGLSKGLLSRIRKTGRRLKLDIAVQMIQDSGYTMDNFLEEDYFKDR